jgi:hypothetical protein
MNGASSRKAPSFVIRFDVTAESKRLTCEGAQPVLPARLRCSALRAGMKSPRRLHSGAFRFPCSLLTGKHFRGPEGLSIPALRRPKLGFSEICPAPKKSPWEANSSALCGACQYVNTRYCVPSAIVALRVNDLGTSISCKNRPLQSCEKRGIFSRFARELMRDRTLLGKFPQRERYASVGTVRRLGEGVNSALRVELWKWRECCGGRWKRREEWD